MARDIEEFLRRAAERRQQQKQGGAVPASEPQPAPPSPFQNKSPRKQFSGQPPMAEEVVVQDVEIVNDTKIVKKKKPKRESVSEHVERHLDTSDIKQKTQSLGSQVARVGQDFDRNVKEHLNKDICSVDDGDSTASAQSLTARPNQAAKLREMLARPESIGQAILLSEILKPRSFEDE